MFASLWLEFAKWFAFVSQILRSFYCKKFGTIIFVYKSHFKHLLIHL